MPRTDENQTEFDRSDAPDNEAETRDAGTRDAETRDAIQRDAKRKIVFWIAVGILAWGMILALGDMLVNHDVRRSSIIIASVLIFVGFWLAMLRTRRAEATPKPPNSPEPPASFKSPE